jgi:hypothetical protein
MPMYEFPAPHHEIVYAARLLLLGLPVLGVGLALANAFIVRMLRQRGAGTRWWAALSSAWLAGAALGVWSGFFEYQPSPRLRVVGAPVPAAFFHWEGPPGEEQWVGFITQAPVLFAVSNVAILALLAGGPVGLAFWVVSRLKPPVLGVSREQATPADGPSPSL